MPHDQAYLLAEKKIEEARRSDSKKLDLSAMKLTELPEAVGELIHLQSLNLAINQLTRLPDSIGNLTQLQRIIAPVNDLAKLPDTLGQLTRLQTLHLNRNKLIELPESIGNLTQLELLYLSGNELKTLPKSIEKLIHLQELDLASNQLAFLLDSFGRFKQLRVLNLDQNQLATLPESIGNLAFLESLQVSSNKIERLPAAICDLHNLKVLYLAHNNLTEIPERIGELQLLEECRLENNKINDLPSSITNIEYLQLLNIQNNPLNRELAEAYRQGFDAVKVYLRAKAVSGQITLNQAKLILVGEGEVGKTCLIDALLGNEWLEHDTTHGIQIRSVILVNSKTQKELTLNGWDFGGQRIYRPTHQLFFSAPAVYLVVWKPREGPQQGFVKEWIHLIKRREPSAKILVVATHGGPQQRQPDIDRQELWDLFGKDTVVDFFFVDSKPEANGKRKGIAELKEAIALVAATLPEVGRSVPKSFADVRAALQARGVPYLPLDEVLAICRAHNMDDEIARLFITISHRLGHLTHYETDPALRDIVILRPDWLATAMSYVLDDAETRKAHGLVKFSRLGQLWDDPTRGADTRYPATLHPIFLRLMERFDLSYRVADPAFGRGDALHRPYEIHDDTQSLIAQLVPDTTPKEEDFEKAWLPELAPGDIQQTQICRIVDTQNGQSANAEGLFFQLIVRLHRYSLGRVNYPESVHWQRGLVLDADYNGRALLRHIGNDVHITVRAAYPQGFLNTLTDDVKYLVESFWEGLRCDVTVPCLNPNPCSGLFEVRKLIENKKRGRPEQPCPVCNEWQNIDSLLLNAPAAQPAPADIILSEFAEVKAELAKARQQIMYVSEKTMGRFDRLDDRTRRLLSQVDRSYTDLLQVLTDEAKDGPRLFSLFPLDNKRFDPKKWIRTKFRLTLWCEHSRLPLLALNGEDSKKGVYDLDLDREWFKKVAPYLKFISGTLGMVLPIAASSIQLSIDDFAYKLIEEQLDFGKSILESVVGGTDSTNFEHGIVGARAENASLRELHALLKAKDPGFGGLVRVLNKRQEFLWVHERFAGEY